MIRAACVSLVALTGFALAADEKKVAPFAPKDGRFSVAFPDAPKEKVTKVGAGAGEIVVRIFTVDQKDRAFIVTYSDYAPGTVDADADKVLTGVIDGNVKSLKGKLATNEKLTVGKKNHPGREVRIEFGEKKQVYRARVYLVGTRLYQVVALGSEEFAKSKTVDEYLKSFALVE